MKKYLFLLFLIFIPNFGFSQKIFLPKISKLIEVNNDEVIKFDNCKKLLKKIEIENYSFEKLSDDEQKELSKCSECKDDVYDILDCGCSWYCGGRIDSVHTDFGEIQDLKNINDLNYGTFCRIKKIKSKFSFHFNAESSMVTDIIFNNGNTRNKDTYKEFSRIKTVKVYYNDKAIGIFKLNDQFSEQTFTINSLGNKENSKNKKPWKITFEIIETFNGLKDDIAISEIYFYGESH